MAISWAEGLLAGAAGVAEYSQQEQIKRQTRQDKMDDLQNRLKAEQAKSLYAIKLNEYSKGRSVSKALESVESGSLAEQIVLYRSLGVPESTATLLADRAMQGKEKKLERPGAIDLPEFAVPSMESNRAESPLRGWARNFIESESTGESPIAPVTTEEVNVQAPDSYPPSQGAVAAPVSGNVESQFTGGFEPPLKVEGSIDEVIGQTGNLPYESMFAKPVKWKTDWTKDVVDGKRVAIAQQSTEQGQTRLGKLIPLGEDLPEDVEINEIKNGDKTDIYAVDPKTGKSTFLESLDSAPSRSAAGQGGAPAGASSAEVDSFVKSNDDDTTGVNTTFPEFNELGDKWFGGLDSEEMNIKKREMAQLYLPFLKNKTKERGTPSEAIKYRAIDAKTAKGYTYLNAFEPSEIAEMMFQPDNPIDPTLFKNNADDLDPLIKAIRNKKPNSPLISELEAY